MARKVERYARVWCVQNKAFGQKRQADKRKRQAIAGRVGIAGSRKQVREKGRYSV